MSSANPVGTIAFILDEEALLVRVNKGEFKYFISKIKQDLMTTSRFIYIGWQYIAVRIESLIKTREHIL